MRGGRWSALGLAAAGLGAVGAIGLLSRSGDAGAATEVENDLVTAVVEVRDMDMYQSTTAVLQFIQEASIRAPATGTVTAVVAEGEAITAGTIVATVDGEPVVAFYGDVPSWRDLDASSSDDVDIFQLEANLVALGFDPDGDITIDGDFDSATTAAVDAWTASLGLDSDGSVPQERIVWIPGELLIDTVPAGIGATVTAGDELVAGRLVERVVHAPATVGDDDGTDVTDLTAEGVDVVTGTVLFHDDGQPVVAVVGDVASQSRLDRDLSAGVSAGPDVALLEQILAAGGFDAGGALTIDDAFDDDTASAVADWYRSLGVDAGASPVVPAGSFIVVGDGLTVGQPITVELDDGTQRLLPTLTAPARVVTTSAPLGDDHYGEGAPVTVEYPDGSTTTGHVATVGTTATNPSGQPGGEPSVEITIQVDEIPESVAGFVEIPVTLDVLTESIADAFVVPASALVALAEGGYALEVADGSGAVETADGSPATSLIGVTPGVFQDGFVEVTGDDLVAGMNVVVPS